MAGGFNYIEGKSNIITDVDRVRLWFEDLQKKYDFILDIDVKFETYIYKDGIKPPNCYAVYLTIVENKYIAHLLRNNKKIEDEIKTYMGIQIKYNIKLV